MCTLITTFALGLCSCWVSDGRDLAVQNHVVMMTMMKVTSADWQLEVLVIDSHPDQDGCVELVAPSLDPRAEAWGRALWESFRC